MLLDGTNRKNVTNQAYLIYIEGSEVRIHATTVDDQIKIKIRDFIQAEILPYEKGLFPADNIVVDTNSVSV